jgi:hypothetical protein
VSVLSPGDLCSVGEFADVFASYDGCEGRTPLSSWLGVLKHGTVVLVLCACGNVACVLVEGPRVCWLRHNRLVKL